MKQKITIEVQMNCEKCRTNAMKMAAVADGVSSVSLEGENKVVVIGDDVDVATLTQSLRKKLKHARLLTVEEVKPKPIPVPSPTPPAATCHHCPSLLIYEPSQPNCLIM